MVYLKWFLFLLIGVPFELFAKLISPILAFFVQENGWLPDWLYWFQTPDNSCDGDAGHRKRWPRDGVFWTWARRAAWLFRNSAYGFNYFILGIHYQPGDLHWHEGNPEVGDLTGISGLCKWFMERDGKLICFQFYYVRHYRIFGHWKCVRAGMGWKMWGGRGKRPLLPALGLLQPLQGVGA